MTDPYRILGVPVTADDDAIRAAYLAAIRGCPPERDRLRFERVRSAYESIATARARLAQALFDHAAPTVADVLDCMSAHLQPQRPPEWRLRTVLGAK